MEITLVMPELRLTCPSCSKKLKIMNSRADKPSVRCPFCDEVIPIDQNPKSRAGGTDHSTPRSSTTRRTPPSRRAPVDEEFERRSLRGRRRGKPTWRKIVSHITPLNVFWTIVGIWFSVRLPINALDLFRCWSLFFDDRFGRDLRFTSLASGIAALIFPLGFILVSFNYRRDEEIRNIGWCCVIVGTAVHLVTFGLNFSLAFRGGAARLDEFALFATEYGRLTHREIPNFRPPPGGLALKDSRLNAGKPRQANVSDPIPPFTLSNGQYCEIDSPTTPNEPQPPPERKTIEFRVQFDRTAECSDIAFRWIISSPTGRTESVPFLKGNSGWIQQQLPPSRELESVEGPFQTWLESMAPVPKRLSNVLTLERVDQLTPSPRFRELTETIAKPVPTANRARERELLAKLNSPGPGNSSDGRDDPRFSERANGIRGARGFGPPATIDDALAAARSGDIFERREGIKALSSLAVEESRRGEVAELLAEELRDGDDSFGKKNALAALRRWGTAECVSTLVAAVDRAHFFEKDDIVSVVASLKNPAAIAALAKWMEHDDAPVRESAMKGLVAHGSAAETDVLKYLNHPSANVRGNACLVLAEIGTQQSVRPLMAAVSKSKDRLTANAARQALQTVQFRMRNAGAANDSP